MFSFFTHRYIQHAKEASIHLRKKRCYEEDVMSSIDLQRLDHALVELSDLQQTSLSKQEGEARFNKIFEAHKDWLEYNPDRAWKENVEIFFVALIIALAVRCYFIQPFKIPTHSMRPSLYGILLEKQIGSKPSWGRQLYDMLVKGKTYQRLYIEKEGTLLDVRETKLLGMIPVIKFEMDNQTHTIWSNLKELKEAGYKFVLPMEVPAGTELVNYTFQNGDHLLVNKIAYHFTLPYKGQVMVFTTANIHKLQETAEEVYGYSFSQYYIKRCVGVGGDTLKLDPPYLYVNGHVVDRSFAFQRIYSMQNGYHGYVYGAEYLRDAEDVYQVPSHHFWAMGDNSRGSFDSRGWGPVPQENLVGSGSFVYWPFTERWGWIR